MPFEHGSREMNENRRGQEYEAEIGKLSECFIVPVLRNPLISVTNIEGLREDGTHRKNSADMLMNRVAPG